ncbi:ATP-binding protein [Granulicoccus phenolivorans]|uniref:ATP-binding protein n=1 Tax=Granulicoccus phenolivorans TaxID=266854 RepID=UPI00040D277E|nr:ATP-binding protein [Granulicoccus phenolivorans]
MADSTTTSPPAADPAGGQPDWPPAKAYRVAEGSWIGGVCTGLAKHLHCSVLVLRIAFVVLLLASFLGALVYAALWLLLPPDTSATAEKAPGLESASRNNMRTEGSEQAQGRKRHKIEWGPLLAVLLLAAGVVWLVQASGRGLAGQLFWPIAFAAVGVALVWRTADNQHGDTSWKKETGGRAWLAPLVARGRLLTIARTALGLGLVGASIGLVMATQSGLRALPEMLVMSALAIAGVGLVMAPWLYRTQRDLQVTREQKVRADARADMAAHLHDSVLQTLAMIQKQADDPKAVATLARKQERELRLYLYGDQIREATVKAALTAAAAEVEDERGLPVDVVCVGDADLDESLEAMIRAAREAMTNAAKHSGAPRIDVYAEVTDDLVEIFVRDRGKGFDIDEIGDDRMGVKGSIIGRMERHGGTARIRSTPEDGTEVKLEMTR